MPKDIAINPVDDHFIDRSSRRATNSFLEQSRICQFLMLQRGDFYGSIRNFSLDVRILDILLAVRIKNISCLQFFMKFTSMLSNWAIILQRWLRSGESRKLSVRQIIADDSDSQREFKDGGLKTLTVVALNSYSWIASFPSSGPRHPHPLPQEKTNSNPPINKTALCSLSSVLNCSKNYLLDNMKRYPFINKICLFLFVPFKKCIPHMAHP